MTRPVIAMLPHRASRAASTHLSTWSREPTDSGGASWRMFRAHRLGGVLVIAFEAHPGLPRNEAAMRLREYRKVLFGRDKRRNPETAAASGATVESQVQHASCAQTAGAQQLHQEAGATAQGTLF